MVLITRLQTLWNLWLLPQMHRTYKSVTPNLPSNQLYNLEVTMIASKGFEALPLPYDDPNVPRQYWLTYCMFGVVTETDKFSNPKKPDFKPIVDSFRIRSDRKEFASFLQYDARLLEGMSSK